MRWRDLRRSENVEDQRGIPAAGLAVGGGVGALVPVLLAVLFGADPRQFLPQQPAQQGPGAGAARPANPAEDEAKDFVTAILGSTEDVWTDLFAREGKRYEAPKLRLFTGSVDTQGCGH